MKRKITKAEWEALSADLKLAYVAEPDGTYKLPLGDDEDFDKLRRAKDREKAKADKLAIDLAALTEEIETLRAETPRKAGDIAVLEKAWKDKLAAAEATATAKLETANKHISTILIQHAATTIAAGITAKPGNAAIMLPHIMPRLEVVFDGDVPTVKVKGKDGKLSAMTSEDLQKELQADPTFETVVVVSKASGAGGTGGSRSGSSGGAGGAQKKFAELTGAERTQMYRDDPAEFQRQSAAAQQDALKGR